MTRPTAKDLPPINDFDDFLADATEAIKQAQQQSSGDMARAEAERRSYSELLNDVMAAIRRGDEDTEMETRAEIMGRFKRTDPQITAALFRLLTEQETGKPAGSSNKAEALDLSAIEGMDALLDGFIPANDLVLTYGTKGSGKTVAALAAAFAVIDGTGFLDHARPAEPGAVLFIASDSGAAPLKAAMQDLGVADHPAVAGPNQRFYVWAHDASQGMAAWGASINGCVELLRFVKVKNIRLVVSDSAKAVCAKAGISYTDNDSVTALLTFIKETVCVHASVMILSHDGTEKGSHSGAKAWAEIPSMVHNIVQIPESHGERLWRVVKNRMRPLRELRYAVGDDGRLVVCPGVEVIRDATAAVLDVLTTACSNGVESLSRKALTQEIHYRFGLAPKTVDNTLTRMVRARRPDICRLNSPKGHYKLAPRVTASLSLSKYVPPFGKEQDQTPVIERDLVISRGVGNGNIREVPTSSHFPGGGNMAKGSQGLAFGPASSLKGEIPIGELPAHVCPPGRRTDAAPHLPGMTGTPGTPGTPGTLIGSGFDAFDDGDDPAWGPRQPPSDSTF